MKPKIAIFYEKKNERANSGVLLLNNDLLAILDVDAGGGGLLRHLPALQVIPFGVLIVSTSRLVDACLVC